MEAKPANGEAEYSCLFADLAEAELPDWPPEILARTAGYRILQESLERAIEPLRQAIGEIVVGSPYPLRAAALKGLEPIHGQNDDAAAQRVMTTTVIGADVRPAAVAVTYFLFSTESSRSQSEAVGQLVIEARLARGGEIVACSTDMLRDDELSPESRRQIQNAAAEESAAGDEPAADGAEAEEIETTPAGPRSTMKTGCLIAVAFVVLVIVVAVIVAALK